MNKYGSPKNQIRFQTPEQLQSYLERAASTELNFRAYPISGAPETFHYSIDEKAITREDDGRSFDDLSDFIGYAFQCDSEGYPRTEYVDVEILNR